MSEQHVNTPWKLVKFYCGGDRVGIQDANGRWIGEDGYDDVKNIPRFDPDRARRIVACVNACAEISTDELEQSGINRRAFGAAKIESLIQQRDELLAALLEARNVIVGVFEFKGVTSDMIDTVISKIQGGAA